MQHKLIHRYVVSIHLDCQIVKSSLSDLGEPLCVLLDFLLQENTESLHAVIHLKVI